MTELGWNYEADGDDGEGILGFTGDGHREGRELLRGIEGRHGQLVHHVTLSARMHQNVRLLNGDELRIIAPGIARVGF